MEGDEHESPTWGQFLGGYTALIVSGVALALVLERWSGIDKYRTVWLSAGILFCAMSSGRPAFLYSVVRNTGWFALIRREPPMRLLLAGLGLMLLLGALLLPAQALRQ